MTVQEVLTEVAYRLGLNSVPNDANELNRWISAIASAERSVIRKNYWWFTQSITAFATTDDTEIYTLASDYRDMIEIRLNRSILTSVGQSEAFSSYLPMSQGYTFPIAPSSSVGTNSFYVYGTNELHIIPKTQAAPSSVSVSSITRSGSTATVTTTSDHGLLVDDYVSISGASETGYNGAFRVTTVPSTTSLTYTVTSSPSTPATGTITAQRLNCVYRYWSTPTRITSLSQSVSIPDLFIEAFIAYVKARIDLQDSLRGSAADDFDEFNELIDDLTIENNKRKFYYKNQPSI